MNKTKNTDIKKENLKTERIQVRVSERELALIKMKAEARGMTISEYLLTAMLRF